MWGLLPATLLSDHRKWWLIVRIADAAPGSGTEIRTPSAWFPYTCLRLWVVLIETLDLTTYWWTNWWAEIAVRQKILSLQVVVVVVVGRVLMSYRIGCRVWTNKKRQVSNKHILFHTQTHTHTHTYTYTIRMHTTIQPATSNNVPRVSATTVAVYKNVPNQSMDGVVLCMPLAVVIKISLRHE